MASRKPTPKKPARRRRAQAAPPITEATILDVYVAAGGRCSFYGCNVSVMREPLTNKQARLGNIAHIVGEKPDGPRGDDSLPMAKRSESFNLMLMCTKHHTFIDKRKNVPSYPVARLLQFKRIHEARIALVTGMPATAKTHAVRFFGQVRGNLVTVSDAEVFEAVFAHEKRYTDGDVFDIDLGSIPDAPTEAYWTSGKSKIDAVLGQRILPLIEKGDVERLSVFALARIPLICYLGRQLGDKVPTELYQKHRTGEEQWAWPTSGREVQFELIPHGDETSTSIALFAPISGGDIARVRRATKASLIYEIRPVGEIPSRTLLDAPATLQNFRRAYHEFMSTVEAKHPTATRIDYFLAVPAPIAIICGRDLQKGISPVIVLHELVDDEYHVAFALK
jgi:SMODS-associated and fused to various effectors sensor domain